MLATFPTLEGVATVVALHVAPGSRLPMKSVSSVSIETQAGIVGDRYHGSKHRQVSVQSLSSLAEAAEAFGSDDPGRTDPPQRHHLRRARCPASRVR